MKKNKISVNKILPVLIAVLVAVAVVNQYVIMTVTGNATQKISGQYGVPFTQAGYNQLLGYDSTISLDGVQMKSYVGLDVEMPCCGFRTLSSQNCGCGHHVALSGLAKLLISKGYSRGQVQDEINSWKGVFFGNNAVDMGGC